MNKKTILIIDDDPDILKSVRAILEANDYKTVCANNGADGIAMHKAAKPDLILCDIMMEHVDEGVMIADYIRKVDPGVPIFIFSSIGETTSNNLNIHELGFSGVFQKPVDPDFLIKALAKVLG
jgi:CheY-like chemotaxis protein